jgi:cold shock CspA family protein
MIWRFVAKPWSHGEFDTFVHIQAVQARLVI